MAKTKSIRIRISAEDKRALEAQAEKLGLNVSEYLRLLVKLNPRITTLGIGKK